MRLLAFVMLLGCSKSGPSCAEQALDLDRFLTGIEREGVLDADVHLVTRDDLPSVKVSRAAVVQVNARDFLVHGELLSPEQLGEALERERLGGGRSAPDPQLVYLVVDEAAPWDAVVAATETAAHTGYTTAGFLFARAAKVTPPPRSPIDDQLDKIDGDASSKATQLAKLLQGVIKSCPALTEAFGRVAAVSGEDKAGYIIQQVQPALLDCECKVDIPSLRSVMWRILANTKPTTEVRLTLDRAAPPIALPAKTPWRDAQKQLKPGATSGWLVVRP